MTLESSTIQMQHNTDTSANNILIKWVLSSNGSNATRCNTRDTVIKYTASHFIIMYIPGEIITNYSASDFVI